MNDSQTKCILLVEDNPGDVVVIRTALPHLGYPLNLQVVYDGQSALDYLSGKPPFKDRSISPLPDLILLDLSLPKLDGFHVLEWVRTEPHLRSTPIVILATSSYSTDIQRAYAFGANSFITKPDSLPKLIADLRLAFAHWLYHQPASAAPELQQAA